jgi:hypothetical protein
MKKYLILSALFILTQTTFCLAGFSSKPIDNIKQVQQDSLKQYTGKYRMQQGMQTTYMEIYIENGKLTGRDLSRGEVKILDHLSGDDFILSKEKVPVKFIRDKSNRVYGIAVMGNVMWTRSDGELTVTGNTKPADPKDYLGKYQITANGQTLYIEISLKNAQLQATQLWDSANSGLDYISGDDFIVNALNIPMKFIRDNNKIVIQLLLNGTDLFTKVKN